MGGRRSVACFPAQTSVTATGAGSASVGPNWSRLQSKRCVPWAVAGRSWNLVVIIPSILEVACHVKLTDLSSDSLDHSQVKQNKQDSALIE